jgi:hypothetical protein
MSMDGFVRVFIISTFVIALGACASSDRRQRQVIRDQVVAGTKFYCEFLNGEKYTDIDVALNIAIGEKCELLRQVSITGYRSISEIPGVIYCCNLKVKGEKESPKSSASISKSSSSVSTSAPTLKEGDSGNSQVDSSPSLGGATVESSRDTKKDQGQ